MCVQPIPFISNSPTQLNKYNLSITDQNKKIIKILLVCQKYKFNDCFFFVTWRENKKRLIWDDWWTEENKKIIMRTELTLRKPQEFNVRYEFNFRRLFFHFQSIARMRWALWPALHLMQLCPSSCHSLLFRLPAVNQIIYQFKFWRQWTSANDFNFQLFLAYVSRLRKGTTKKSNNN